MNISSSLFRLKVSDVVIIIVCLFCFFNVLRVFLLDSMILLVICTIIIFVAAAITIVKQNSMRLSNIDVLIVSSMIVVMFGYISNYKSDRLLVDVFIFHITALLFLPLFILLINTNIK